jgi:hypothetical protein
MTFSFSKLGKLSLLIRILNYLERWLNIRKIIKSFEMWKFIPYKVFFIFSRWLSMFEFSFFLVETIFFKYHNFLDPLCRNPTLAKCGGETQHFQSWGFGVLRDSWMFRARQQGPKHLALKCSWCHWKGLEAQISKMASHWSFGHLSPKLWAKEGSGVKLAVWLLTTKSRESTSSRPPNWECDMALERSRRGLQLWFRPRCDQSLQSGVMSVQSPRTLVGTISGQFRDSNLGVPGKRAIWM